MFDPARTVVATLILALPPVWVQAQEGPTSGEDALRLYTSLGEEHRNITTDDRLAQAYFDQGLRLMYAFDGQLALRSFREAQRHDPQCAMCYWGEAWALSPYLNGVMGSEAERTAHRAIQRARELARSDGTQAERDLIEAFDVRFAADPDRDWVRSTRGRMSSLDSAYARAMREVAVAHPEDDDVLTLWAESMLLLRPRYEIRDLSDPRVRLIRRTLEEVLDRNVEHPGACHLYIHLMEMSAEPAAAEPCADVLDAQIPGASHIQHMPSHIYMRTGRFGDAVRANVDAWHVDQQGEERGMVPIYPSHNLEMLVYAANFDGQGAVAVDAAENLAEAQPSSAVLLPETLALFGRWDEILERERLPDEPFAEGGWRFARGLALLRTGERGRAGSELERLRSLRGEVDEEGTYRGGSHRVILSIAALLLEGEIALNAGRTDEAIRVFEEAVATEDGFAYSEPEPWHIPARRFLGAALLEADRFRDAERVYREALEDHHDEGWSLFGLQQALRGQGRVREARRAEQRFEDAWVRSDVWLASSRM